MYQKPEVRIIDHQQVDTKPAEVTSAEAAALLAKYGYKNTQPSSQVTQISQDIHPNNNLTADQLYQMQLRQEEEIRRREMERRYGPKSYTFDGRNINYSNVEYRDLGIDGQNVGIQIQVVSDMPLNNNNYRR
jgi:hypothetical protein